MAAIKDDWLDLTWVIGAGFVVPENAEALIEYARRDLPRLAVELSALMPHNEDTSHQLADDLEQHPELLEEADVAWYTADEWGKPVPHLRVRIKMKKGSAHPPVTEVQYVHRQSEGYDAGHHVVFEDNSEMDLVTVDGEAIIADLALTLAIDAEYAKAAAQILIKMINGSSTGTSVLFRRVDGEADIELLGGSLITVSLSDGKVLGSNFVDEDLEGTTEKALQTTAATLVLELVIKQEEYLQAHGEGIPKQFGAQTIASKRLFQLEHDDSTGYVWVEEGPQTSRKAAERLATVYRDTYPSVKFWVEEVPASGFSGVRGGRIFDRAAQGPGQFGSAIPTPPAATSLEAFAIYGRTYYPRHDPQIYDGFEVKFHDGSGRVTGEWSVVFNNDLMVFKDARNPSFLLNHSIGMQVPDKATKDQLIYLGRQFAEVIKHHPKIRDALLRPVDFAGNDKPYWQVDLHGGDMVRVGLTGETLPVEATAFAQDLLVLTDAHNSPPAGFGGYAPVEEKHSFADYEPAPAPPAPARRPKAKTVEACASQDPSIKWLRLDACVKTVVPGTPMPAMRGPDGVSDLMHKLYGKELREGIERVFSLIVDSKLQPLAVAVAATGTRAQTIIDSPELIRPVLLIPGAAGLFLIHNHPSEKPAPSQDDHDLTHSIVKAAKLFHLKVFDHVIVTRDPSNFYSFVNAGLMP